MENTEDIEAFIERVSTSINGEAIEQEMYRLPADLAYANARYADAHDAYLHAKLNLDRVEATQYLLNREELEINGAKFTERVLDSRVKTSEEYASARQALVEAEAERERRKGIAFTLAAKKDMLISIGNRINAEMRLDPVAAANARRDRDARDQHGT